MGSKQQFSDMFEWTQPQEWRDFLIRACSMLLMSLLIAGMVAGCSSKASTRVEATMAAASTMTPTGTTNPRPALPTATPFPQEAVLAAYERYWKAYSIALFELDADLVQAVAASDELDRIRQEIDSLRSQGVALKVNTKRNPLVVEVSESSAIVFDEMMNNSFYIDAETKQPPQASGSGELIQDTYYFQRIEGSWKVVRSVRQR